MAGRMDGKVAIVTGAASRGEGVGNGKAMAMQFAREGAKVVLVNRNEQRAQVLQAVLLDAVRLAAPGLAVGGLAALGAAAGMRSMLLGVSPLDPISFFGAAGVLIAVVLMATRASPGPAV